MNKLFINIKVDKEERPDLDKIYQLSHQLLTGRSGGWPLTVFINPFDQTAFFSGTYFPKVPYYGLPSFKEILLNIIAIYQEEFNQIKLQNSQLHSLLNSLVANKIEAHVQLTRQPIEKSQYQLMQQFDLTYGGFGGAPKFPQISYLQRLIDRYCYSQYQDEISLNMVKLTLNNMLQGGIYDQLDGGFFRYSVDEKWMIPHFEKMLYDNAQFISIYTQAFLLTKISSYKDCVLQTAKWVLNTMENKKGGFFTSIDADSDGHEGKFYCWTREEFKSILSDEEYPILIQYYGLINSPNFENYWHLHISNSVENIAKAEKKPKQIIGTLIQTAKQKLLQARHYRRPPKIDEKVLTSWNGLMIKSLALAGFYLNKKELTKHALKAIDFIKNNLWDGQRLYVSFKNKRSDISAFADDYIFLMEALLFSLQAQWRNDDLNFIEQLANQLLKNFEDKQSGGFFFTSIEHEKLIQRPKPLHDEAIPAANGIAVTVLLRLGSLLGNSSFITAALRILKIAWPYIEANPINHASLLQGLDEYLNPSTIIILRGEQRDLTKWQKVYQKSYSPYRLVFAVPNQIELPPPLIAKKAMDTPVAYICQGQHCLEPISDMTQLPLS